MTNRSVPRPVSCMNSANVLPAVMLAGRNWKIGAAVLWQIGAQQEGNRHAVAQARDCFQTAHTTLEGCIQHEAPPAA